MSDSQEMYKAIVGGDVDRLANLHGSGQSLNDKAAGQPLIETAAAQGAESAVFRYFLENGADLDIQTNFGDPLPIVFADIGRFSIVEALLAHGADPWSVDRFGASLLLIAQETAERGVLRADGAEEEARRRIVERLLAAGHSLPPRTRKEVLMLKEQNAWPPESADRR